MILRELREGKSIQNPCPSPDFEENAEVIVAGLGTAGAYSAIAAAQEGAAVIGLERSGCCGGMCTLGSVNGYYYGGIGGMYEATDSLCKDAGKIWRPFGQFHPDTKKLVLEKQLVDAGVEIRYHAVILGVYTDDAGKVRGVRALIDGQIRNIGCQILIDGTSEGHLIRMCGIPTAVGRETDGTMQPFTSVRVTLAENGTLTRTNFDSGYVDQYDNENLSKGILFAHSHHSQLQKDDGQFLYAAPLIGVREGLHFEGMEKLTLEDVLAQKPWEDTLLYAYSDIDKHGKDLAFDEKTYQDWFMLSNLSTVAMKIPVPLGCLLPKGVEGLIATGRCLSADSYVASAIRMNRDMYRLGEACGVAAALAAKSGVKLSEVDRVSLKKKLLQRGCFDSHSEKRIGFNFPGRLDDFTPVCWFESLEEIREHLDSKKPGVAIWSCRLLGKEIVGDALLEMMKTGSETLRFHAAIALGVTGDERALPVLREIVAKRDSFFFEDCRRSNQLRSANAIFLCGRLGDIQILPELFEMLKPDEFQKSMYHDKGPSYQFGIQEGFNQVYFQHLSCTVAALIQISQQHPDYTSKIRQELMGLEDCAYIQRITPYSTDTSEYRCAHRIWEHIEVMLENTRSCNPNPKSLK